MATSGDSDRFEASVAQAASWLVEAQSVLFVTGAGVSADSGLPTYRGVGGLYDDVPTPDGMPIEQALSGEMLARDPKLVWKYMLQVARAVEGAAPNRAHEVIAEVERAKPRVWTLTQNVDGFHRRAGSRNLIDIHGDLSQMTCTRCPHRYRIESVDDLGPYLPPFCNQCGADIRPEVVLFGEFLLEEKVQRLREQLERGFDLIFTIGTTSVFAYISGPILQSRVRGTRTVEINPDQTEVSDIVDLRITGRAATTLDAIWTRCQAD